MSNEEFKRSQKVLEDAHQERMKSPEKARAILVKAGIITKTGKLSKRYRPSA